MNDQYVAVERRRAIEEEEKLARMRADVNAGLLQRLLVTLEETPSLHHLLGYLKCSKAVGDFQVLVHEYLPEAEQRIMGETLDENKVQLFCRLFGAKYFPLDDVVGETEYPLEAMTYVMPVTPIGLSYEDYHDFQQAGDETAALYFLIEYPWYDKTSSGDGFRTSLYDYLQNKVSVTALQKVPKDGWTLKEISKALTGKPSYDDLIWFARWVSQDTDSWFLDCSRDAFQEDGAPPPTWDIEEGVVDGLTEQWHQAKACLDAMEKLRNWMHEDLSGHFGELVDALRGKMRRRGPKPVQKTLFDELVEKNPASAETLLHPIEISEDGVATTRTITPEQFISGRW